LKREKIKNIVRTINVIDKTADLICIEHT
jgi:hypothetical protein